MLCSSAPRQTPKPLTSKAEFIPMSFKILLFSLEGISAQQTGTACSELMKSYSLWLIIYFNRASSPPTMHTSTVTQMPSWQVLHSLRERESAPMPVAFSVHTVIRHRHQISLSSSLNRTGKGKFPILNQNNAFLTSNPKSYLWHQVNFPPHTYSLLGRYLYLKILVSKTCLPVPEGY